MPKRGSIKWTNKQTGDLRKAVKNFNAKISRVSKNKPILSAYQPDKVSINELKKDISDSTDLNRIIKSLKRYTQPGAENIKTSESGLTLTQYEIKDIRIKNQIRNRKRQEKEKILNPSIERGNMGSIEKNNLKPRQFSTNVSKESWDKFVEVVEKEIKSNYDDKLLEQYKENYLKAIREQLLKEGSRLYESVKKMDAKFLFENSSSNPMLQIDSMYEPQDIEDLYDSIMDEWDYIMEMDESEYESEE